MAKWGRCKVETLQVESALIGRTPNPSTAGYLNSALCMNRERSFIFSAVARIDNRDDLLRSLDRSPIDGLLIDDQELVLEAYAKWGEKAPTKIYGDWAFAVWNPSERRLFLARDHFGNSAVYYYVCQDYCVFATSRKAILDLNLVPIEMDELYLAQVLTSWMDYHGERTIHKPIRRLPPAHTLTVTPEQSCINQYWRVEDTPILRFTDRHDYVAAFLEVFDKAVQARLRTAPGEQVAVSLSGGLDSGSVAVTAANLLRNDNRRLHAFTSVPLNTSENVDGICMGNEFPLADATARFAGNIDLLTVEAAEISPIQGIRQMLQIINEPTHAAGNFYWMLQLRRVAMSYGCNILLTGAAGNGSISWKGDIFSQPLAFQLQQMGYRRWLRNKIKRALPPRYLALIMRNYLKHQGWYRSSAIHPEFARRIQLFDQFMSDPRQLQSLSRICPDSFMLYGRNMTGTMHVEIKAAMGIEARDPTADARVVSFTHSVPDHVYIDPKTGQNRWLIREAMKDRLPDEVRLNRRFGRQAADRTIRLRTCADEVNLTLDELSKGPAAVYIDVPYMRQVWQMIQNENSDESFSKSGTILLRGIMAGLFVNNFNQ